tara:strand:+ start:511 stop:762 length:252 start_codon:yes stop_codon:yes gene_type:complete
MNKQNNLIFISSIISAILNIVFSFLLSPLATKDQIKPPNGAAKLSFVSQIMHMLVHHKQVIFTSSLIVSSLVAISVFLALKLM